MSDTLELRPFPGGPDNVSCSFYKLGNVKDWHWGIRSETQWKRVINWCGAQHVMLRVVSSIATCHFYLISNTIQLLYKVASK